jgi:hypothetical protein
MANPVKTGDAKPWVCSWLFQHDRQVAEEGMEIPESKQPWAARGCFLPDTGARPTDKGKPGENRGRKVTGLHPPCGYDRRTSELETTPATCANLKKQETRALVKRD